MSKDQTMQALDNIEFRLSELKRQRKAKVQELDELDTEIIGLKEEIRPLKEKYQAILDLEDSLEF